MQQLSYLSALSSSRGDSGSEAPVARVDFGRRLLGTTARAILFAVAQCCRVGELDALVPQRRGGRRVGRLFVVDLGAALHVGFRRVDEEEDRAS